MNVGKIIAIYESGPSGRAWKGDRVSELLKALSDVGFRILFFGLRGLRDLPFRLSQSSTCILFTLPGQLSRIANLLNISQRDFRTAISQSIFAVVTYYCDKSTVITQTTLGSLVRRLKSRGHFVWAECDMTCPTAWRNLLLEEAHRLDAIVEINSELPSKRRELEERRAFEFADRIIVFSTWAAENLPADVQKKAIVVPSVSVKPEPRPPLARNETPPVEFLFVGQLGFRKGIHILIEAMKGFDDKNMVCHAFGGLRDNFGQYMGRTGLLFPATMRTHGPGDWRNFVKQNPRRYVAVLPSLVEGSPRFIYEAAAMGIPAIVSPAACPSFLKEMEEALILDRPEAGALHKAMSRILEEYELWERLSAATHSLYCKAYETSYGQRMAQLFRSQDD